MNHKSMDNLYYCPLLCSLTLVSKYCNRALKGCSLRVSKFIDLNNGEYKNIQLILKPIYIFISYSNRTLGKQNSGINLLFSQFLLIVE